MSKLDEMIGVIELRKVLYEIWNHSIGAERLIERIKNTDNNDPTRNILIERLRNKHQSSMRLLDDLLQDDDDN